MEYLLTAKEMSAADRYTSKELGIPSIVLMERAALAVADAVRADYPSPCLEKRPIRIAVVAGKGNNGADALAAGRILLDAGYEVEFYAERSSYGAPHCSTPSGNPDNMETQLSILASYGVSLHPLQELIAPLRYTDVILDGLFGTGLSRDVSEDIAALIRVINLQRRRYGTKVYALDIPSGIDASTGAVMGAAVEADVTVTFAFYKRGQFLYPGTLYCGQILRRDIGITARALSHPKCFTFFEDTANAQLLSQRTPSGNKGTFGKVLVIAGSRGVCGASYLCAKAALRTGAGMVRIYTQASNREILQNMLPEAMCSTYEDALSESDLQTLAKDLSWADVVAIGPGIGKTGQSLQLLTTVLQYAAGVTKETKDKKRRLRGLVIDADAIRLIAESAASNSLTSQAVAHSQPSSALEPAADNTATDLYALLSEAGKNMPVILTPHAAECAALLRTDLRTLQQERFCLLPEFAAAHHCTLLGKDARTLVAGWKAPALYLNTSGNDGLATAGSGDVLTGITAALLAQDNDGENDMDAPDGFDVACRAACLHGRLADLLLQTQTAGSIMATDLIDALKRFNKGTNTL